MESYSIFDSDWVQALGWTLLHSLWQGVAIAMLLAIALLLLKKKSANMRYLFGIFALTGLLVSMIITFSIIYPPLQEPEPLNTSEYALLQIDNPGISNPDNNAALSEEDSLTSVFMSYYEEHMPFIMLLYLIGVLILTMRMLGELVYIQNLRHSRSHYAPEDWIQKLNQLASKMGIKTSVGLKESLQVRSPMIIGFLKPIIFLPIGLLANLPTNQIESILAHELAHIRRHDYLVNLLQSFVEILLFFNPAVWWISSFIRSEREHCCDDIAIELTGDKLVFAQTLANLEEWRFQNGRLAVAFGGNRNSGVLGRIQRLLEKKESTQLPFRLFWGAMILSSVMLLAAFDVKDDSILKNNNTFSELEKINEPDALANLFVPNEKNSLSAISSNSSEHIVAEIPGILHEKSETSTNQTVSKKQTDNFIIQSKEPLKQDTVPDNIKALERQRRDVEQSFQLKREALFKQVKELEIKRLAIEKEVQKQEFAIQSEQLIVQREIREIEKDKMMLERDLNLQQNREEEIIMELQFKMKELELQLQNDFEEYSVNENDEDIKKEIEKSKKEIQEVRKSILMEEKELRRKELEAKKATILKEKEMQEVLFNIQMKEHEKQLKAHSKEGDILNVEESMRLIEIQMQGLEMELQHNLQQLQHQIENEYHKMEKEEY